jgi:DNA polymerase III alpha subunit
MWINSEKDLIAGLLNHGPTVLENAVVKDIGDNIVNYLERITTEHLDYPLPITVDQIPTKRNWFIPYEYKNMDIERFLIEQCPKENYDRLHKEIALYRDNDMVDVLKAMKYLVDTLRANNVVWGVGRGSSVASYALYLIGVHKIDSIKYNLPIEEFFKGEQNG